MGNHLYSITLKTWGSCRILIHYVRLMSDVNVSTSGIRYNRNQGKIYWTKPEPRVHAPSVSCWHSASGSDLSLLLTLTGHQERGSHVRTPWSPNTNCPHLHNHTQMRRSAIRTLCAWTSGAPECRKLRHAGGSKISAAGTADCRAGLKISHWRNTTITLKDWLRECASPNLSTNATRVSIQ